jgi:hypothetical protein
MKTRERKVAIVLLGIFASSCFAAEPGAGYKLVEQTKPDEESEFFGGPHIDIVVEVYSRPDAEKFFGKSFKIVLSSLADPSQKELLFEYERDATATLSPNGKWIVVNDRPVRGHCEPRLFKQQEGLKFTEVEGAKIREKAIDLFVRHNKLSPAIRKSMIGEGDSIVESLDWADDSNSLLLRVSKGRTGEPIWIGSWRCLYDLKTHKATLDLNILNRGSILPGKKLGSR